MDNKKEEFLKEVEVDTKPLEKAKALKDAIDNGASLVNLQDKEGNFVGTYDSNVPPLKIIDLSERAKPFWSQKINDEWKSECDTFQSYNEFIEGESEFFEWLFKERHDGKPLPDVTFRRGVRNACYLQKVVQGREISDNDIKVFVDTLNQMADDGVIRDRLAGLSAIELISGEVYLGNKKVDMGPGPKYVMFQFSFSDIRNVLVLKHLNTYYCKKEVAGFAQEGELLKEGNASIN